MNYILKNDHTYEKVRDVKEAHTKNMCCALFDISTDRKGPLYTMVRDINFDFIKEDINIVMDVSYAPIDVPFDNSILIPSNFKITSLNTYYNLYPLIKQIFAFNTFRENESTIDNQILIQDMQILYGNNKIDISEKDSDKTIKKIFKKMRMLTCTDRILDDKFLLMKDGIWDIYSYSEYEPLDMKFDKIGLMVPYTESLYLMSYKEYELFQTFDSIDLELRYRVSPSEHAAMFDEFYDEEYASIISINDMKTLLEVCMFIPQMILMEQSIYTNDMSLKIIIDRGDDMYSLIIDQDEIKDSRNTCLYYIIKKLLKM